jgi:hypothetical protein
LESLARALNVRRSFSRWLANSGWALRMPQDTSPTIDHHFAKRYRPHVEKKAIHHVAVHRFVRGQCCMG